MRYICLLFISLIFIASCSLKTPEVTVTGEKTVLENQVLGSYGRIEEDVWTLASVRSSESTGEEISSSRKQALEAMENQRFNADDIRRFHLEGSAGENNKGYLEFRNTIKTREDSEYTIYVKELIEEENNDRKIIMYRITEVSEDLTQKDITSIEEVFANMYQEKAPAKTWIENIDGVWEQKPEISK